MKRAGKGRAEEVIATKKRTYMNSAVLPMMIGMSWRDWWMVTRPRGESLMNRQSQGG